MTREQFAQAWRRQVREDLATDPLIRSDVSAILARLNDLDAPRTLLDDIVTQRPGHTDYDAYDAAALRHIGLMLNLGRYVTATIQLEQPSSCRLIPMRLRSTSAIYPTPSSPPDTAATR